MPTPTKASEVSVGDTIVHSGAHGVVTQIDHANDAVTFHIDWGNGNGPTSTGPLLAAGVVDVS